MLQLFTVVQAWLAAVKRSDERGATMVEYGLMVALIAVVALAAVVTLGTKVSSIFDTIQSSI
jgi:pilus assembly protein Flp/PilA